MKREHWIVLFAFLGGIVLANLLDREMLMTYGILNEYFLSRHSYQQADGNRLLCYIIVERSKAAFTIFLLGKVMTGKRFVVLINSLVAAGFGFLLVVAIINMGLRGIAISVAALLPQWIFYLAAIVLYGAIRSESEYVSWGSKTAIVKTPEYILKWILILLCIASGIIMESFFSPKLLSYVL